MVDDKCSVQAISFILGMLLKKQELARPGTLQEMIETTIDFQALNYQRDGKTDDAERTFKIINRILEQAK